ncbi:sigma-70 family RNA polymerase sigma factor [Paraconexibacter antarcticus]|uniref:RNA polymerase sigma factor n=1 Tax=Paraconexibacter antarcticus TaxID=2949664 RepID=A0ABY5DVZ1_9ACTN|nr:sigma-70 family RNA polymerase sigma factor [Paraconexibacter antarcticus]UTI65242.1 sigma-70 family RNA polymerase sigma factor [Paraconexibacter antarcticus]
MPESHRRLPTAASDDALIERSRTGDAAAFARLVERHRVRVLAVARSIAPHAAEDVTQQTFLSAWLALGRYDATRGSVATWLCGIARNRSIDALRAEGRRPLLARIEDAAAHLVCQEETPFDVVERRTAAAGVRRALLTLGPEQRTALTLAYYGGLSQQEIQVRTEVPLGTVKGRTRLGLRAMRVQLGVAA